ncbi:MAG: hypothetical protein H7222_05795 [Methylotenera sp.]|nr:hypothetical protein [Oligoflexia bacterium]
MLGILSADFLIPNGLLIAGLSSVLFGVIVLSSGKRLPRQGDWLAGLGVLLIFAWVILSWGTDHQWLVGWIWPKNEAISLQIGIWSDVLGSTLTFVGALLAGILLLSRRSAGDAPQRVERQYSASALSVSGLAFCWYALTPWLVFVGLGITLLGGVISLAASWDQDADAGIVASFIKERVASLTLMVIGASALASMGVPLQFAHLETVKAWDFSSGLEVQALGAGLLVFGWVLFVLPFPFLTYLARPSSVLPASRLTFAQLLPSWGAFAILFRLYPQLQATGVLPYFGWLALAASVLSSFMGFLQKDWKLALNCWLSSAFGFSAASLLFCGPTAAFACLICTGLAACMLAQSGCTLEDGKSSSETPKASTVNGNSKATWAKVSAFFAAAVGTGMIGFASCFGFIQTLGRSLYDVGLAVGFGIVLFLLSALIFRLALQQTQLSRSTPASWFSVLSPYLLLIPGVGILWNGSISGGALPAGVDLVQVMTIWDLPAYLNPKLITLDENGFLTASWIHWWVLVIAGLAAYWFSVGKRDAVVSITERFPKFSSFVAHGYGMDLVLTRTFAGIHWVGNMLETAINDRFWNRFVPRVSKATTEFVGKTSASLDEAITVRITSGVRHFVDVPAKLLQLIHNGDVQWYLFFAIASGIAVLIHFLRF